MDLGEKVCHIGLTRGPSNVEKTLLDPVFDPIVAHVDGLRSLLLDRVSCNANCAQVIASYLGLRLWISDVKKDFLKHRALLAVDEEGGILCLGG